MSQRPVLSVGPAASSLGISAWSRDFLLHWRRFRPPFRSTGMSLPENRRFAGTSVPKLPRIPESWVLGRSEGETVPNRMIRGALWTDEPGPAGSLKPCLDLYLDFCPSPFPPLLTGGWINPRWSPPDAGSIHFAGPTTARTSLTGYVQPLSVILAISSPVRPLRMGLPGEGLDPQAGHREGLQQRVDVVQPLGE